MKEILKAKGELDVGREFPKIVKRKISLFCCFFFSFGNKEFGGVSYLAVHAWAENF